MQMLNEMLSVALAAAPWLLFGLFVAGLIKAFFPDALLERWIGGRGLASIARAAVIGAPLPLCSCGAIPTALALHRKGAGRGPTTAFLIGTPGVGVDSIAITYALLGPFMMIARVTGAIATAIATGLLVAMTNERPVMPEPQSACGGCCEAGHAPPVPEGGDSRWQRLRQGMHYAFNDVLDDISLWVLAGLMVAGALMAWVPPEAIATYGSGFGIMLLMAVVGIPLYLCATAATPIAAGMLLSGVSPGAVIVFLLAGPITSLATLGVLRRELGGPALAAYLAGILSTALIVGVLTNVLVAQLDINLIAQVGAVQELLPEWLEWSALGLLGILAIRPLRRGVERLVPQ
ncbi:SO_0444 family Cu/Zn efflux transporter [Halomonas sp. ZH2S]|uniref:SO_0444 family Cu/Zn efflux transporter n=1 Tax=Vreelandella zhuhanensis TaxID=2684210 RepID=A0A7X3H303_9GAMM|nr:SO_0444 family Cu/Zn efflux transporter [Halomonas zhuhanensis]MWJ28718.1 SO_0444 family Cu/Zn efflux transporter [Halomonas zhuhanensis]